MFFDGDLNDWEVDVLHDSRATSIHLLHEFPNPIIDNEVILFFLYIVS